MSAPQLKLVVLGLTITSSWGNGHATTYRALLREFAARGHDVLFLERDVPWYARERDMPAARWGRIALYRSLAELRQRYAAEIREADVVIIGSYVPRGIAVGRWVLRLRRRQRLTAFYDIDTPVTLAALARGECTYLDAPLLSTYGLYLSFSGGPNLARVEHEFGTPARALYCSVDPAVYYPESAARIRHDLGYMGTYSPDRQPPLKRMLIDAARQWPEGRFVVAGPQYPPEIVWPENVARIEHLPPNRHRAFYNSQRFTLNITRADMVRFGWSPSVRLFEAAACGTAIISDAWPGLDSLFHLNSGKPEIMFSRNARDTLDILCQLPEREGERIGQRARKRILAQHTAAHRAEELERYLVEFRKPTLRAVGRVRA